MAIDKKIKYEMQGGVRNYLGKQPEVQAPRKWQSSPDKPATELAYITKAEKDLILKANIHGGLEKGPNMGPSGIMSLDSFGDADAGVSGGLSGGDVSDAETGRSFAGANTISDTYGRDLRAGAVAAGGRQRLNEPQSVLNQVRALQKQFGPRVGTNKFGFLSPKNIFTGLLGLVNPVLGFLGKGLTNIDLQGLRGYNPDGTPMSQEDYEKARKDRQIQGRIDNIMERQRLGKNFSQTNLNSLTGMTDRFGEKFSPSTAQNVLTGRDLKGFTDSRMGITSPELIDRFSVAPRNVNVPTNTGITDINNLQQRIANVNKFDLPLNYSSDDLKARAKRAMTQPGMQIELAPYEKGVPEELQFFDGRPFTATRYDPYKVNTQSQGINTIDVGYPSNDLMAGLTKIQQKMLAGPQKNLRDIMGISDQETLDNISPFNDPEDPATIEEVKEYYGIV